MLKDLFFGFKKLRLVWVVLSQLLFRYVSNEHSVLALALSFRGVPAVRSIVESIKIGSTIFHREHIFLNMQFRKNLSMIISPLSFVHFADLG